MAINPNRQVDEMFRKPKSRFLRRLVANYVVYVEVAGFLFIFSMIAALVYFIFFKDEVKLEFKDSGKLRVEPTLTSLHSPAAGTIGALLVVSEQKVDSGQALMTVVPASGVATITLRAGQKGMVFFSDDRWSLPASESIAVDSGAKLLDVVDFSRLSVNVTVENRDDLMRIKRGAKVYLQPDFKDSRRILMETGLREDDGIVRIMGLNEGERDRIKDLMIGTRVSGRDNKTQFAAFTIKKVENLEIEVETRAAPLQGFNGQAMVIDSLLGTRFDGYIARGEYILELDMARMPDSVRESAAGALEHLDGLPLAARAGQYRIGTIENIRLRAKVTAHLPISETAVQKAAPVGIPSAAVTKRKFAGEIVSDQVPEHVQRAAETAWRQGQRLVVRAEVVVMEQTLAARLFKRN